MRKIPTEPEQKGLACFILETHSQTYPKGLDFLLSLRGSQRGTDILFSVSFHAGVAAEAKSFSYGRAHVDTAASRRTIVVRQLKEQLKTAITPTTTTTTLPSSRAGTDADVISGPGIINRATRESNVLQSQTHLCPPGVKLSFLTHHPSRVFDVKLSSRVILFFMHSDRKILRTQYTQP